MAEVLLRRCAGDAGSQQCAQGRLRCGDRARWLRVGAGDPRGQGQEAAGDPSRAEPCPGQGQSPAGSARVGGLVEPFGDQSEARPASRGYRKPGEGASRRAWPDPRRSGPKRSETDYSRRRRKPGRVRNQPRRDGRFGCAPTVARQDSLDPHRGSWGAGASPALEELPAGCRFAPRCPKAQDKCRRTVPPLTANGAHRVACWFPD